MHSSYIYKYIINAVYTYKYYIGYSISAALQNSRWISKYMVCFMFLLLSIKYFFAIFFHVLKPNIGNIITVILILDVYVKENIKSVWSRVIYTDRLKAKKPTTATSTDHLVHFYPNTLKASTVWHYTMY